MFASTPRYSFGVQLRVLQRRVRPAPTGEKYSWRAIRSIPKAGRHSFQRACQAAYGSFPSAKPNKNRLTCGAEDKLVQEIAQLANCLVKSAASRFSPGKAVFVIHRDVFGQFVCFQICKALRSKRIVDSGAYLCIQVRDTREVHAQYKLMSRTIAECSFSLALSSFWKGPFLT